MLVQLLACTAPGCQRGCGPPVSCVLSAWIHVCKQAHAPCSLLIIANDLPTSFHKNQKTLSRFLTRGKAMWRALTVHFSLMSKRGFLQAQCSPQVPSCPLCPRTFAVCPHCFLMQFQYTRRTLAYTECISWFALPRMEYGR